MLVDAIVVVAVFLQTALPLLFMKQLFRIGD